MVIFRRFGQTLGGGRANSTAAVLGGRANGTNTHWPVSRVCVLRVEITQNSLRINNRKMSTSMSSSCLEHGQRGGTSSKYKTGLPFGCRGDDVDGSFRSSEGVCWEFAPFKRIPQPFIKATGNISTLEIIKGIASQNPFHRTQDRTRDAAASWYVVQCASPEPHALDLLRGRP